jgi:hypothetical protein
VIAEYDGAADLGRPSRSSKFFTAPLKFNQ